MKNVFRLAFAAILMVVWTVVASADIAIPTLTKVYFMKDGIPINEKVEYSVKCSGRQDLPWEDQESELKPVVFSYFATCPAYGCSIYEGFYMNYISTESCDLEGSYSGKTFKTEDFATTPLPNCEDVSQFDFSIGDDYYKYTTEYNECLEEKGVTVLDDDCLEFADKLSHDEIIWDEDEENPIERSCKAVFDIVTKPKTAVFSDVGTLQENYDAVKYVKDMEMVKGYTDGTFRPDQRITRAEFLKILVEAVKEDGEISSCTRESFKDVSLSEWYAPYVCVGKESGIVGGYPDGTFKPGQEVNFVEAAKMILTAFKLTVGSAGTSAWYKPYVDVLVSKSAIPTSLSDYADALTRGEMAEMIYRVKAGVLHKDSANTAQW